MSSSHSSFWTSVVVLLVVCNQARENVGKVMGEFALYMDRKTLILFFPIDSFVHLITYLFYAQIPYQLRHLLSIHRLEK